MVGEEGMSRNVEEALVITKPG